MTAYLHELKEVTNITKTIKTYFINGKRVSLALYTAVKTDAYRIDSFSTEIKGDKVYQYCSVYSRYKVD